MRPWLWKLELGFLNNALPNALPNALGPYCPKLVFTLQTPNVRALGSEKIFMSGLHKILHQISSFFQIFGHFWQSYKVFIPRKKPFKNLCFGAISEMQIYSKSCLKKPIFWSNKIQISREPLQFWLTSLPRTWSLSNSIVNRPIIAAVLISLPVLILK